MKPNPFPDPRLLRRLTLLAFVSASALASSIVFAGSSIPGSILPGSSISPGLSQSCIDRIDPKLSGAAASRATRACRRPTGQQAYVRPKVAQPAEAVTATAAPQP